MPCDLSPMKRPMKKLPISLLAVLAASSPSLSTYGVEYDLTAPGNTQVSVPGDVGGTAIFSDFFTQPAGTGVFEPFLTIERDASGGTPSNLEQGYNTDGFSALYLDQQRPQWNDRLRVGDLAVINVGGINYYGFELDANEPGGNKSLISVDNIRVYTSPTDNTGLVQNNLANLDLLGTLRWAMNDPLKSGSLYNVVDWVKLDSNQENVEAGDKFSNGGSGKSDMIVYIPVTAFAGAALTDYLWFYNLNGVHYSADYDPNNVNLGAEAGYEEWRAVVGPNTVPDGGATLAFLGISCLALVGIRRKIGKS
jgi:hypothetical protein